MKKLIEVSLPLDIINDASAYDKMPGIGAHPKGIHHWWARLPLPTARAILFASVVNDPSTDPAWTDKPVEEQDAERERLFDIIRRLMQKKLHEKPEVYEEAQEEMLKHTDGELPTVLDPFAGGGSIPLEAQRLGFKAVASDLNPVAVTINRACLEIVPRWLNHDPVNPDQQSMQGGWPGATGLAEDVRYYGDRIRNMAIERVGHLYPKAALPDDMGGGEAEVIAWIWARTVQSPDPAANGVHVPLISTLWLSSKKGKEAYLQPQVDAKKCTYSFLVRREVPKDRKQVSMGTKVAKGQFRCILSGTPMDPNYVRAEAKAQRLRYRLIAVVADGGRKRAYLPASSVPQPDLPQPNDPPDQELPEKALGFRVQAYGIDQYQKMFHPRQLVTMTCLVECIAEIRSEVISDAEKIGRSEEEANGYADAVQTFLAFAVDRCADFNCSLSTWKPSGEQQMHLFGRQAIPMVWDFAEANMLGQKAICWHNSVKLTVNALKTVPSNASHLGKALQQDAVESVNSIDGPLLVSTDPPYYDNIGYAALSDFFYVWLRKTLGNIYPDTFSTVLVPKMPELTASPERFEGDKQAAKEHFESGFKQAFTNLRGRLDARFPLTVYYAFKQSDEEGMRADDDSITLTTGWETLLNALMESGYQITATWPVRASQKWRMRAMGSNALASYIVLACRARPEDAPVVQRRDFLRVLQQELPAAVEKLQAATIPPVDLAQAAIGPGMAVYSRFSRVVEHDGTPLRVRAALRLINEELSNCLEGQAGAFDEDTRWAMAWFQEKGYEAGSFGEAEVLATAKAVSVQGIADGGILKLGGSEVRLLRMEELTRNWDPAADARMSVWECASRLAWELSEEGEEACARLLRRVGERSADRAGAARDLAYWMFQVCEKKGMSAEALPFNALVMGWPSIQEMMAGLDRRGPEAVQGEML